MEVSSEGIWATGVGIVGKKEDKMGNRWIETADCPVYLQSQGKKWSPYIKVAEALCSRCPFFNKQCDGQSFKPTPAGGQDGR